MRRLSLLFLCLTLTALSAQAVSKKHQEREAGVILYKMKSDAPAEIHTKARKRMAARSIRFLRRMDKLKMEVAHSDDRTKTEEEQCADLMATGAVEYCEPNYLTKPLLVPNDPLFPIQIEQHSGVGVFHVILHSTAAWDITTGIPSVIVAVADSGIEATHPDLAANLILPGYNSIDGGTNTSPATSHGTQMVGAIAAIGNNNLGIAGLAWNVKILPIRITNDTVNGNATCESMASAIQVAADRGARIISLSYGTFPCTSSLNAAALYARNLGALLFVGAGNDSTDVSTQYPDFPSYIFVGATDELDTLASFSNYGTPIDLVAPGTHVFSTNLGGTYSTALGTSIATAVSAGVAALALSANPALTPDQLESVLYSSAVDLGAPGDDNVFGHGRVDALAAVQTARLFALIPAITSAATITGIVGVPFNFQLTATNNPTSYSATGLPAGLGINSTTGLISGTPTTAGVFNIALRATNSSGTGTATLILTLNSNVPLITSVISVPATLGTPFSYQITATNNPTSFNATALPFGLSVNTTNGLISGTPAVKPPPCYPAQCNYVETNQASTNGFCGCPAGTHAPASLNCHSAQAPEGCFWAFYGPTCSTPPSCDGCSCTPDLPSPPNPLTITWVTPNPKTVSASPGVFIYATVTVQFTTNKPATCNLAGSVDITTTTHTFDIGHRLQPGEGYDYGFTCKEAGNPSSTAYSVQHLIVPNIYNVPISATNSSGTGTANLAINMSGSSQNIPQITSPANVQSELGMPMSYQITADNYPTHFSATGLPDGLTINEQTGLISGVVTSSGTFHVIVTATNQEGVDVARLTLVFHSPNQPVDLILPPTIISSDTASGIAGSSFTYQIQATNHPMTFEAVGLPRGLAINSQTGEISGIPISTGTSTVSLIASNAEGKGAVTMVLTVKAPTIDPSLPSNPPASDRPITLVPNSLSGVRVYPNPWKITDGVSNITFDTLSPGCSIKIFTLTGQHLRTLEPSGSQIDWDLKNDHGETVVSGIYLYLITDAQGGQIKDKLVIIR